MLRVLVLSYVYMALVAGAAWYIKQQIRSKTNSFIPSFIHWDAAFLQLGRDTTHHLAGIIGKVKITHLLWCDWNYGKRLLVLLDHGTTNLHITKFTIRPPWPWHNQPTHRQVHYSSSLTMAQPTYTSPSWLQSSLRHFQHIIHVIYYTG